MTTDNRMNEQISVSEMTPQNPDPAKILEAAFAKELAGATPINKKWRQQILAADLSYIALRELRAHNLLSEGAPVQGSAKPLQNSGPTEAQIEAAAKALRADEGFMEEVHSALEVSWSEYIARLVLVAAQGAAPPAEALPETGNEMRDEDGDLISSGKHLRILQQGMYVCDTCTNSLGLNVRWDHAIKRDDHTPVLPSSGVDEDALAEVIRAAAEKAWNRCVGEMPIDPDWKNFYSDNNPYRAEAYRQERREQ